MLKDAFRWKDSIGPTAERPGHWNLWGYWSTDGVCETSISCSKTVSPSTLHLTLPQEDDLQSVVQCRTTASWNSARGSTSQILYGSSHRRVPLLWAHSIICTIAHQRSMQYPVPAEQRCDKRLCSTGLGLFEYMQLAEEVGAVPVWVINNGVSHQESVKPKHLRPWLQAHISPHPPPLCPPPIPQIHMRAPCSGQRRRLAMIGSMRSIGTSARLGHTCLRNSESLADAAHPLSEVPQELHVL